VIRAKELKGSADEEKSPKKSFLVVSKANYRPKMLTVLKKRPK
jgi:hypothetical protein